MAMCKTFSLGNQFKFVCPLFNAETKIASCLQLRDLVWRGERPDMRRGCQAAMCDSKCPIVEIVNKAARHDIDEYFSAEPRLGKIQPDILAKIAPVKVQERTANNFGVVGKERDLLLAPVVFSAKDKADAMVDVAPRKRSVNPKLENQSVQDADLAAAISGDMSVAVNKAMNEHTSGETK